MKQSFFFALALLIISTQSQGAPLKEVHKSNNSYENIATINVQGDFCKVILMPSPDKSVVVDAVMEASKEVEGFDIEAVTEGNTLSVKVLIPREHISTKSGEIRLKVPAASTLNIKTRSGYIEAINIDDCTVDAHASYGKINAENVSGKYSMKTSTGTINATNLKGKFSTTSTSGNIELSNINGEVMLITDNGEVSLENIKGQINTQSNTSAQTINNLNGNLTLRTSTGEISLKQISGHLTTNNDDGDVHIENFEGTMELISISGNLVGTGIKLTGNTTIKTTKGRIEMELRNQMNELTFDMASNYGFLYIPGKSKKKKLKSGNGPILIQTQTNNGAQRFTIEK
jgi:DUF4097 and DUF4098 domain-containing protein YvlB